MRHTKNGQKENNNILNSYFILSFSDSVASLRCHILIVILVISFVDLLDLFCFFFFFFFCFTKFDMVTALLNIVYLVTLQALFAYRAQRMNHPIFGVSILKCTKRKKKLNTKKGKNIFRIYRLSTNLLFAFSFLCHFWEKNVRFNSDDHFCFHSHFIKK